MVITQRKGIGVVKEEGRGQWGKLGALFLGGLRHDVAGLRGKAGALELDGSVFDAKLLGGELLDGGEQAFAFVEMHVGNAGVKAEGVMAAAERPEMNIVDLLDAFDSEDGAGHLFDAQLRRTAFEKNVRGLTKNAEAGPEDQQADGEAEKRVDPLRAGQANEDRAANDGDIREGVAEIVNQDAAEIEVAAATDKSERDSAVDSQRGDGGPDHPAFDHFDRRAKTHDGFVAEPERKQDEDESIGEGSESAGAVIAVRFFAVGRALSPAHGQIRNPERGNIGKIMDGVVQQGDAVAENAADDFRDDQAERRGHGPPENRGAKRWMRMARVVVAMIMAMLVAIVVVMRTGIVRVATHAFILRVQGVESRPGEGLVGTLTRPLREYIDAPAKPLRP